MVTYAEHEGQLCIELGDRATAATLAMECQRLEHELADLREAYELTVDEVWQERSQLLEIKLQLGAIVNDYQGIALTTEKLMLDATQKRNQQGWRVAANRLMAYRAMITALEPLAEHTATTDAF